MTVDNKQSGFIHMILVAVVVVAAIVAIGGYVYYRDYKPSKITDSTVKTQLQQTANDLKHLDLGAIAKSVNTVTSVQTNFNFNKSNNIK